MALPLLMLVATFDVVGVLQLLTGEAPPQLQLQLQSAGGGVQSSTSSDSSGNFKFVAVRAGQYQLVVQDGPTLAIRVPLDKPLQILLGRQIDSVTVTAEAGRIESPGASVVSASVRPRGEMLQGAYSTIGQSLQSVPGVMAQQTGTAQVSPFLRGLTGYQVVNLVDGVRINNSTYRSGPNQYLALLDTSQISRMETVLGPNSVAFGSDAMGGTIQMVTRAQQPGWNDARLHGEVAVFGAQADLSAGTDLALQYGGPRLTVRGGAAARRHQDLNVGGGTDSRHSLRRFFGLRPDQVQTITGERQQDTGFDQMNWHAGSDLRIGQKDVLRGWLQSGEQWRVRNTKDLWGGLGRQISTLEPQQLRLGYVRWESVARLGLDTVSLTGSANLLRDGSRRQGLLQSNTITTDLVSVDTLGAQMMATKRVNHLLDFGFGGEAYRDQIQAARTDFDPARQAGRASRPLYPNDSTYRTVGLFLQNRTELFQQRLLLTGGLRWTRAGLTTQANSFGTLQATQTFPNLSYQGSARYSVLPALHVFVLFRQGFRAPNTNDLGAIGLNDLGYEVPAKEAVDAAALQGATAGEDAVRLGRSVAGLRPETLKNYEAGFRVTTRRVQLRSQAFWNDLYDPIVRRTLLFAANQVPATLAGLPVRTIPPTAAQAAQGVVTVATSFDSRAVKAFVNDGQSRYYGAEVDWNVQVASRWNLTGGYSYLLGRDLYPNRNIRRLPPQQGSLNLRHVRGRWWGEVGMSVAGAQRRLSGGDLDDERIGASRSRSDIAGFFNSSRLAPYITNGRFQLTGETLAEIQTRVLPQVASNTARVPLYQSTAGWAAFQVVGGWQVTEMIGLMGGVTNLLDQNYRVHGSGVDAAGRNAFVRLQWRF